MTSRDSATPHAAKLIEVRGSRELALRCGCNCDAINNWSTFSVETTQFSTHDRHLHETASGYAAHNFARESSRISARPQLENAHALIREKS